MLTSFCYIHSTHQNYQGKSAYDLPVSRVSSLSHSKKDCCTNCWINPCIHNIWNHLPSNTESGKNGVNKTLQITLFSGFDGPIKEMEARNHPLRKQFWLHHFKKKDWFFGIMVKCWYVYKKVCCSFARAQEQCILSFYLPGPRIFPKTPPWFSHHCCLMARFSRCSGASTAARHAFGLQSPQVQTAGKQSKGMYHPQQHSESQLYWSTIWRYSIPQSTYLGIDL